MAFSGELAGFEQSWKGRAEHLPKGSQALDAYDDGVAGKNL